jgi:hypothetical protein
MAAGHLRMLCGHNEIQHFAQQPMGKARLAQELNMKLARRLVMRGT